MPPLAFEGLRVCDFSATLAGPYCTEILALMGAQVIRIESRKHPDILRQRSVGRFQEANFNKLGVSLDLSFPEAIDIAKRLVKISDLVVESFRPGVMEKLGLGYETIRQIKPDIIMASLSGFGRTGPESQFRTIAPVFAALGGLSSITGYQDGIPTELRVSVDIRNGMFFAVAVLSALIHRQKTGEGQYIDHSGVEGVACLIGDAIMDYTMNGRVSSGTGNRDAYMAPHNCYRCLGEDQWISIAVCDDQEWGVLCHAMGKDELIRDERFCDTLVRFEHQDELDEIIQQWTINHTPAKAMQILQNAGVAAMPSFSSIDIMDDPHLKERDFLQEVEHPELGKWRHMGVPWRFSATPARIRHRSPLCGEHNQYVFEGLLGMSSEEVEELEERRIAY